MWGDIGPGEAGNGAGGEVAIGLPRCSVFEPFGSSRERINKRVNRTVIKEAVSVRAGITKHFRIGQTVGQNRHDTGCGSFGHSDPEKFVNSRRYNNMGLIEGALVSRPIIDVAPMDDLFTELFMGLREYDRHILGWSTTQDA